MNRQQVFNLVQKITGIALVVSFLVGSLAAIKSQLIPSILLIATLPITALIVAALTIMSFKRVLPAGKSMALICCSVLLSLGGAYVYNASNTANSFISSIQADNYTYEEYSIVAKKDSSVALTADAKLTLGTLGIDANKDLATTEVTNKTPASYKNYNELASLTVALNKNEINGAVLKNAYVQLLKDNYNDFYKDIKVVDTVKVKVQQASDDINGDTSRPFAVYINCASTLGDVTETSKSNSSIVAIVNPQSHKILTVSTPGEYYVTTHGTDSKDRLAYASISGMETAKQTVEDLYGIKIDYYVQTNLQSLVRLIDTLNGVDIEINGTTQTLDGKKVVMLLTKQSASNDAKAQSEIQQKLAQAVINKINNPETLVNYQSLLKNLEGAIKTNASADVIANLVNQQMNNLSKWQVNHTSVDGTTKKDTTRSSGKVKIEVMEPNQESVDKAKETIKQYQ